MTQGQISDRLEVFVNDGQQQLILTLKMLVNGGFADPGTTRD